MELKLTRHKRLLLFILKQSLLSVTKAIKKILSKLASVALYISTRQRIKETTETKRSGPPSEINNA